MKAAVMPARSKASIISLLDWVHSCVFLSPAATRRATVDRATTREDCTNICRSNRSAKRHWIWRTASPGRVTMVFVSRTVAVPIIGPQVAATLLQVGRDEACDSHHVWRTFYGRSRDELGVGH